jgi:hypothetical protein
MCIAFANDGALGDVANTVFVPLIGIFVGLSFACANAHALLQSNEIRLMARNRAEGMPEYAFTFQLAMLVTLTTVPASGLAGLRIRRNPWRARFRRSTGELKMFTDSVKRYTIPPAARP